nr:MAG TPA: hypothetical protein [Caudoviricetes sp.]
MACKFVKPTAIELPNCFKVKHVYTHLICYSCSFQRRHLYRIDLLSYILHIQTTIV